MKEEKGVCRRTMKMQDEVKKQRKKKSLLYSIMRGCEEEKKQVLGRACLQIDARLQLGRRRSNQGDYDRDIIHFSIIHN